MTKETTASQPKSIGDDEDFLSLLNECSGATSDSHACGGDFGTADKVHVAEEKLIAYIDNFRAPAAQASAPIQVVTDAMVDACYDHPGKVPDVAKKFMREVLQRALAAATIPEPVMVAEPVGEVQANAADLEVRQQVTVALGLGRASNASFTWSYLLGCIKDAVELAASTAPAAPMVADPAGVARNDALDEAAALVLGCDKRADLRGIACAIRSLKSDLAATVKAVPSEARIANLEAALRYYAEGNHFMLSDPDAWDTVSGEPFNFQCDEAGTAMVEDGSIAKMVLAGEPMPKDDEEIAVAIPKSEGADAAPLADKTGGGE